MAVVRLRQLSGRPAGARAWQSSLGIGRCPTASRKPVWRATATPPDLRHTWATWLYAKCRDLRVLMELGGWKTISYGSPVRSR